jgi:hypothetical protein
VASDNRDWYRDWWNKKTGYVERSDFRQSHGDREKRKRSAQWRRIGWYVVAFWLFVALVRYLVRL